MTVMVTLMTPMQNFDLASAAVSSCQAPSTVAPSQLWCCPRQPEPGNDHVSYCSLNSLEGFYIGDYIGE